MPRKTSISSDSEYVDSPSTYESERSVVNVKKAAKKKGRDSSSNSLGKEAGRSNHSRSISTDPEGEKINAPPYWKQRALERKTIKPEAQIVPDDRKFSWSDPTVTELYEAVFREARLPSTVTNGNHMTPGDNNVLLIVELPRGPNNDMLLHDHYDGEILAGRAIDDKAILAHTLQQYHAACNKLNVYFHYSKGSPERPWMDSEVVKTLKMLLYVAKSYDFAFEIGAPDHPLANDPLTRRRERLTVRSLELVFENMAIEEGLDHVISVEEFKGVPLIVPESLHSIST